MSKLPWTIVFLAVALGLMPALSTPASALELEYVDYPSSIPYNKMASIEVMVAHHPDYRPTVTFYYTMLLDRGSLIDTEEGWEKIKPEFHDYGGQ